MASRAADSRPRFFELAACSASSHAEPARGRAVSREALGFGSIVSAGQSGRRTGPRAITHSALAALPAIGSVVLVVVELVLRRRRARGSFDGAVRRRARRGGLGGAAPVLVVDVDDGDDVGTGGRGPGLHGPASSIGSILMATGVPSMSSSVDGGYRRRARSRPTVAPLRAACTPVKVKRAILRRQVSPTRGDQRWSRCVLGLPTRFGLLDLASQLLSDAFDRYRMLGRGATGRPGRNRSRPASRAASRRCRRRRCAWWCRAARSGSSSSSRASRAR